MSEFADIWVYLRTTPLVWLTATLAAYAAAQAVSRTAGDWPLLNPVLIAATLLIALLAATETPFAVYFEGAQFVHFLLGPATVALAVPLKRNFPTIRRAAVPSLLALLAASSTAILSAVGIAWLLGASPETVQSLAPKSVTTPIAMAIAEKTGGLPSLTAALVILTGILGSVLAGPVAALVGCRDQRAIGVAAGTAAHGIGTARAFEIAPLAGTFAAVALALNGLLTTAVLTAFYSLLAP